MQTRSSLKQAFNELAVRAERARRHITAATASLGNKQQGILMTESVFTQVHQVGSFRPKLDQALDQGHARQGLQQRQKRRIPLRSGQNMCRGNDGMK